MKKKILILLILGLTSTIYSQYTFQPMVTGLRLPTVFAFLPNGNVIVNQKEDSTKIYNMTNGQLISCFWKFTDSLFVFGEAGLIGVCLDPAFSTNHYVYIYYTAKDSTLRIVKFTENNNSGTNPVLIFRFKRNGVEAMGPHVSGNLRFGPQNKLYFSIGDAGNGSNAQSLTNPLGKILRINSDGTIPTDNPFYDDGNPSTGNDDRIWAYGMRNSWDFSFSPFNDSLYATENGQTANDEINFIRKGKNYGWPVCQGYCIPYNPLYRQPIDTIGGNGTQNYAPTGILIYNGSVFPELYGKAIIGGAGGGPVQGLIKCNLGNPPFNDTITSHTVISSENGVTTILQGPDGNIYILKIATGLLLKMVPVNGISGQSISYEFQLEQNFPNPFNPVTKIKYNLLKQNHVQLKIFDMLGKELETLVDENKKEGNYEVDWNAVSYPSGVYIYRLIAGDNTIEKKMVLIK